MLWKFFAEQKAFMWWQAEGKERLVHRMEVISRDQVCDKKL